MKFVILVGGILIVPSTCSAHSGTIINAVSNYLPFIVPTILGFVAAGKEFIAEFIKRFKKK